MHELAKKENTRTDLNEAQQKRIAARAANAMAQVIQRRNRSLLMWGNKAVIKKYPDGRQEIMIPQVLTAEQEQYEFPPRSKFLKKLATSDKIQPEPLEREPLELDPSALQEWFKKKTPTSDWTKDSQQSKSNKIQFKSDAGKRWANSIQNTTLQPPDMDCKKHYVPRRLLVKKKQVTETVGCIQTLWKEYQKHPQQYIESKIGIAAMSSTGERTPIAGMVQIVHWLHESIKIQEQRSADRLEKLESLLKEEKQKRELAEISVKKLQLSKKRQLAPLGK